MEKKETLVEERAVSLKDFKMNRSNPFVPELITNLGEGKYIAHRSVIGKNTGQKAVLTAVDENMNPLGHTVFMQQKVLDTEHFVKVYPKLFDEFAELNKTTIRIFKYISEQILPNRDNVNLYIEDLIEELGFSKTTIYRALATLCKHNIIARGRNEYEYYINPSYIFNGNRITYIVDYICKELPEYKTDVRGLNNTIKIMASNGFPKQTSLFDYMEESDEEKNPYIEK